CETGRDIPSIDGCCVQASSVAEPSKEGWVVKKSFQCRNHALLLRTNEDPILPMADQVTSRFYRHRGNGHSAERHSLRDNKTPPGKARWVEEHVGPSQGSEAI
ncbi:MAG: hypothetical protein U1E22_00600, partial [Coriobacteriia bacterium]|nr:hypothetical protein [Coriobacteriia bacterium]